MSHGLTLTEASTIIWYAPIDSNDEYEQACGRITRPGQHYTANIINLAGSAVERRMYKRLVERQKVQGALLEMVERQESLV
jgi:SNF2 family DNA or RNA helicase